MEHFHRSDELKADAIDPAYEIGFPKVNCLMAGGVITTHGGPNEFCMAGFSNEKK